MTADEQLAVDIKQWRNRLLQRVACRIETHHINAPKEDFTGEEKAFERGLNTAIDEVTKLMSEG